MIITSYILAPLVGGVIGYVTNDIAIRMLFRPHKAKYIMGWRVPFTPGIIPKEKERIAEAVGTAISDNLMSEAVLEKYLLSDNMVNRVRTSIVDFIANQKTNSETVAQFLEHYLAHPTFRVMRQSCSAYSLSLKYLSSLKPYALRFITFILLFIPSTLAVEI